MLIMEVVLVGVRGFISPPPITITDPISLFQIHASTQCVLAVLHVHASETCTFFPWRYSLCSSRKCLVPYATCSKGVEVCIRPSYRLIRLVFENGRKLCGKKHIIIQIVNILFDQNTLKTVKLLNYNASLLL